MGRKLDYQLVKQQFADRGYILTSPVIEGYDKHVTYVCKSHPGKELKITYKKFKEGRGCRYCYHDRKRLSQKHAEKAYLDHGFILLEKYKDSDYNHKCECVHHRGEVQHKSLGWVRQHGCKFCYRDRLMLNPELIVQAFTNAGYELIDDPAGVKTVEPLRYLCPKHGEQRISYHHLSHGARCRECRNEELSELLKSSVGYNSRNWQGGLTKITAFLRGSVEGWRDSVFQKDGYRCVLTGKRNKTLEAHHLVPFHKIVHEALDSLGIDRLTHTGEYTQEELEKIRDYVMSKHDPSMGVTLTREVHELFHYYYGNDVTPQDFDEFKENFLNGEYEQVS